MPTVLQIGPYKFHLWPGDASEPPHVHVKRDRMDAKFWLTDPVTLARNRGYPAYELRRIEGLVQQYRTQLIEIWNGYFNA